MSNPLEELTSEQSSGGAASRAVSWYRTPIPSETLKALHKRSDWRGLAQALGHLGVLCITGTAAYYSIGRWPWPLVLLAFLAHGTCYAFLGSAVHELSHGTVFKSKWLNAFFVRVFSFLAWDNFERFNVSHSRHHRYTLHPPDDLEVVLPYRIVLKQVLSVGIVNWNWAWNFKNKNFGYIRNAFRLSFGDFRGVWLSAGEQWEKTLYPETSPELKKPVISWARTLLIGHALILAVSAYFRLWKLPLVITFAPIYGSWLYILCTNTQHLGLKDNVSDFRLCCRTVIMNPFLRLLYWQMNYHIEHHMYAAVPCYNLKRLHEEIKHDLPACPDGLVMAWREIAMIQKRQEAEPTYQFEPRLPVRQSV
jgi:fatty acid desaturase